MYLRDNEFLSIKELNFCTSVYDSAYIKKGFARFFFSAQNSAMNLQVKHLIRVHDLQIFFQLLIFFIGLRGSDSALGNH